MSILLFFRGSYDVFKKAIKMHFLDSHQFQRAITPKQANFTWPKCEPKMLNAQWFTLIYHQKYYWSISSRVVTSVRQLLSWQIVNQWSLYVQIAKMWLHLYLPLFNESIEDVLVHLHWKFEAVVLNRFWDIDA